MAREKREDERFSEVIARLTRDVGRLKDCYGAWKMDEGDLGSYSLVSISIGGKPQRG